MRAGLDDRELAVAVRERLRRAGQLLAGPGGVAERAVGVDLDGLPGRADLAGSLPVFPDGLIGQPRIEGGHFSRVVVEDLLHDVLGDIAVEPASPSSGDADEFSIEDIMLDPPGPGEVRVRVEAAGLCHSDHHLIDSGYAGICKPIVPGHEGAGVVESVGTSARRQAGPRRHRERALARRDVGDGQPARPAVGREADPRLPRRLVGRPEWHRLLTGLWKAGLYDLSVIVSRVCAGRLDDLARGFEDQADGLILRGSIRLS